MIGNDVVDLARELARAHARHPRFDARAFDARERALLAADGSERLRWTLWAAKEAAYKALKKLDAATLWAPARFAVELAAGRVRHGAHDLLLRIEHGAEFVHALASCAPRAGTLYARVAPLASGAEASGAARALACRTLAGASGVATSRLSVARRGRAPVLCADGAPAPADLSLSHDGRFIAFACELDAAALAARRAS